MEAVTVDKDILDFLRAIYFGTYTNPYLAASNRAYLDMNRTIRFKNISGQKRDEIRSSVNSLLEKEIRQVENKIQSQEDYDEWHFRVCDAIRDLYLENGVTFYFGQSQKWVNMTMKYLYIIGERKFDIVFDYLHAPLDNYLFNIAARVLKVKRPKIAWSRWDDYFKQYMSYQMDLRQKVSGKSVLRWEFEYWLKEARMK